MHSTSDQGQTPAIAEELSALRGRLLAIQNQLESYAARFDKLRDPRAVFTCTYALMTSILIDQLPQRPWIDRSWPVKLAESFAARFFLAVDRYELGEDLTTAWGHIFDAIRSTPISVVESLVCAMGGHIIHDLPLAPVDVDFIADGAGTEIQDYHVVNDVLSAAIDPIFRRVAKSYNPLMSWLEWLGKQSEELLTSYGIGVSRGLAWYNACRLRSSAHAEALDAIDRSARIFVDLILKPPFWSFDLIARIFRIVTSLGRRWPSHVLNQTPLPPQAFANRNYYLHFGLGNWSGRFAFEVTDWHGFWESKISLVDRFLAVGMAGIMKVVRNATITSSLYGFADHGEAGVVLNDVRISFVGIALYRLHEEYVLHANGKDITVNARERFGPLPFLFNRQKRYSAIADDQGRHTVYYMPLLGSDWVGDYKVTEATGEVTSSLRCPWANGTENIRRR
jgi:uncharacterized protein DUF5995